MCAPSWVSRLDVCNPSNPTSRVSVCLSVSFPPPLATEKGTCEYNRYLAEQNPSKLMRAAPAPRCTELGDYEAKQCKNGTL